MMPGCKNKIRIFLPPILFFMALAVMVMNFIRAGTCAEVEPIKNEYIIPGFPIGDLSSIGISTPQFIDMMNKTFDTVGKKAGITLKLKQVECEIDKKTRQKDCYGTLENLFRTGKADFFLLGPWSYVDFRDKGIPVRPLATIAVDKKKTYRYCISIRGADKEKIKSVKDLKGKTLGDSCPGIGLHQILYENGVDSDLNAFFPKRIDTPLTSGLYSLVLKEVDAVCMNNGYLKFSMSGDKRFKDVATLYCTKEEYVSGPFVYREGINPEVIKRMKAVMLRMHKDHDFGEIRTLFIAINGFLVEATDADYDSIRTITKRAKEKGWTD